MAKAKTKAKGKAGKPIKVDFTGVEGKRSTLPDDDYLVEIEDVEVKEGDAAPYFEITMVVQAGKFKGQKIWDRVSTAVNALWRLRSFLEVLGQEVPDDEMEIDKDEMIGTQLVVVTAQEKYKNKDDEKKIAVRVVDFYSAEDFKEKEEEDDEEDEDEKPKSKKKDKKADKKAGKGKKSKDEDEDEEEEEESEEEEDEDETPEEKKKRLRKERRAKRKAGGDEDEDEDDDKKSSKKKSKSKKDEDEDEEDEEEEKPKSKKGKDKGKKKKGGDKVSADTVNDADEDGLGEIIEEHELDVDLDDFKTLRKKQAAVIDALETAELLEDE